MKDDLVSEISTAFGSTRNLADAAGVGLAAVSLWKRRGIPLGRKWRIQEQARARGIKLPERFYEQPTASSNKAA